MKLKTFRGATMAAALEQVKHQFGRGAVILSTRSYAKGGVLGLREKPYVEITAARAMEDLPVAMQRGTNRIRRKDTGRAEGAAAKVTPKPDGSYQRFDTLLSEVASLKSVVSDLVCQSRPSRMRAVPEALFHTYQRLVESRVAEQIAEQLIGRVQKQLTEEQLQNREAVRAKLAAELETMLPAAGPIQPKRTDRPTTIALIGPTGVGKTTTIAKLAANFCLRQNLKVGLITLDTYRIAAVAQLTTYANIIDVPLEVASSPAQLQNAVQKMARASCDIVLIDTAGRSQRDRGKIEQLHAFFKAVRPDEVHLVLSSACGEAVLSETIGRFKDLGIDRVIFTKLDEAIGFGVILSCLHQANAKLSYVTTGQDVPDDIDVGRGKALAELILESVTDEPQSAGSRDTRG